VPGINTAHLCHHCDTPTPETDNVDYIWRHIVPEDIKSLLANGDMEGLKTMSQHPVRNVFYNGVCLGGNCHGIHGMTPAEPLIVISISVLALALDHVLLLFLVVISVLIAISVLLLLIVLLLLLCSVLVLLSILLFVLFDLLLSLLYTDI
jgi:hypothetical protein